LKERESDPMSDKKPDLKVITGDFDFSKYRAAITALSEFTGSSLRI
jgi:hypothetical protein